MKIDYAEMVKSLAKSGETIASEINGHEAHLLHMALGISGESAELLEAVRQKVVHHEEMDMINLLKEFGDMEFYLEGMRQGLGCTREHCINSVCLSERKGLDLDWVVKSKQIYFIIGDIVCDAGLMLDIIKRNVIYRKELDRSAAIRKIGDIEFHLSRAHENLGFSREDILDANIEKLSKRYEGLKYSDRGAVERADENDQPRDDD